MSTNEKRREVAATIRGLKGKPSIERLSLLADDALDALADLIEPEPERMCRVVWDADVRNYVCSGCGSAFADKYCPGCGAKVER